MLRNCLLLSSILLSSFHYVYGLVCLSCNGISQPRHCHQVVECKINQYCSTELVFNQYNDPLYKLGCHDSENCASNFNVGQIAAGTCRECCAGDLCNSNGCGTPDYPTQAGPVCYNCTNLPKGRLCHNIDVCKSDEVCYTEEFEEFGDTFVTSGCKRSTNCHERVETGSIRPGNLIGKRGVMKKTAVNHVCSSCCSTHLCNEGCSNHLCNDNWKNCSYLSHHYDACNDDVEMSKNCQNTCGKCGSYATTTTTLRVSGKDCVDSANNCRLLDERMNICKDKQLALGLGCPVTCHLCTQYTTHSQTTPSTTPSTTTTTTPSTTTSTTPSTTPAPIYIDCRDIKIRLPNSKSGVYTVQPNAHKSIQVWCDMDTDGGGWTVFQKRFDGSVDFYQNFSAYVDGFGSIHGEFWLGLENIKALTDGKNNTMRIDITDNNDKHTYEQVSKFNLGIAPGYVLRISDTSSGTVPTKEITYFNNQEFTTMDHDRDNNWFVNCAATLHGGFWYNSCILYANPNGQYKPSGTNYEMSYSTQYANKAMQMKFRRNTS